MRPALKRRNTPANEAGNDILRRQAGISELAFNPVESIDRSHHVLGVVGLVLHLIGWKIYVFR
jgi:hypothetical protein